MTQVEAVYEGGVFKPLGPVSLPEKQRVRLNVEPVLPADLLAWLEQIQKRQREFVEQHGYLPDSTSDIAEDRGRDV